VAELPHVRRTDRTAYADLDGAVRIEQPFLDRPPERRTVMKLGTEIIVAGVAVGIDMHHADGAVAGDGTKNGQCDRVIATRRHGDDSRAVHARVERLDLREARLELEGLAHPGITGVGDSERVEGGNAACLIDLAHEARLVADLARPVARTGAVRHPAIEGDADETDIDAFERFGIGRAHEGRQTRVTRADLRVGTFGVLVVHGEFHSLLYLAFVHQATRFGA